MRIRDVNLRRLAETRRTLRLVWRSGPRWCVANAVLMVGQGLLPLAALFLMKMIVDALTAAVTAPGTAPFSRVALLIALAGAVALVSHLCATLSRVVNEAQAEGVTDHVMDILHAKSLQADLEYYESPRYFDTLHLAQAEAPHRPISIVNSLVSFGRSGVSLAAVVALMLSFHWIVAVVLFAAVLPGVLVRFRYSRRLYRWRHDRTPVERLTQYFNYMLTGDEYAKEIRLFNLGPHLVRRYSTLRRKLRSERITLARRRALMEFVAEAAALLAIFAAFALVAHRTYAGALTLGGMVMYYQAFQRGQGFMREMLTSLATIYENNLFIANFYEFLDLEPRVVEPADPRPVPSPIRDEGIVFNSVSFAYPTGTREVLHDISLTIRPGEHVALVGENGAGKTTLIKLLCRLYDPSAGEIRVDGVPLTAVATADWRRSISVVFQDFARYHLSARENIRFGNIDLDAADPRIEAAARQSGADAVLRRLPMGYDTLLSKWFEDGEEISIGEWQKVALARAFLREAPVIVLDEPTSALDARSEFEVFQQFHALARGRTAIIISHRMSTVRMADRIVVLDDGAIVESGTHEALLAGQGRYAALFDLQARSYR